MLLSAVGPVVHQGIITAGIGSVLIQGDTPAQIRKAYGFDQVSFGTSSPAADGSGQTIAIVDPYNDPNVVSDLNVFDQQFGIAPPPGFEVVNQNGGPSLPQGNASWAGEIATDVEWAHAIAPGASLLLVEAASDATADLMLGVQYALSQPGVSVASLSWGGNEFASQSSYDPQFKTPAGHQGVTVVAAAGDNGAASGAQWPASSTNVVGVGGAVLSLADQSGTYGGETSWIYGSGGYSRFETEPAYQQVAQRSGMRAMPDVAYQSDGNVGLALYDSVQYQGVSGWQTTNGTSVGTPEWAALIAIANQGRVLAGQGTLDGPSQTLPFLYSLYGAPGTSGYSTYTSYFNDITQPEGGTPANGLPTLGYDTTTGLGSPKAAALTTALIAAPAPSVLTTTTQPLASQLHVSIAKSLPASVVSGTAGSLRVRLTNYSSLAFAGPVTVDLYVSTTIGTNQTTIASIPLGQLSLGRHASRTQKITFVYPDVSQADYYLTVSVEQAGTAPAQALSTTTVNIAPPFVKLSPIFTGNSLVPVKPGKKAAATISIRNFGNIAAVGTLSLNLFDSFSNSSSPTDPLILATPAQAINLRSDRSKSVHVSFVAPADLVAGRYFLIATISSSIPGQTGSAVIGTR